ncbi:MAG TPA: pyridoxamine 5'-phosphate oxidase [Ferruginibacter sp.]|nr:pyridoxamine 5'-phosphate oxidase [Ferruginibacter sp.]
MSSIADIRKEYKRQTLLESDVDADPMVQFDRWWQEALQSQIDEVNAMTLATADNNGIPSARIVLLKEFNAQGFVFFTNYRSKKGQELLENPNACLVFFWKELERQVRITGTAAMVEGTDSDSYFSSRPYESQLGAWASEQSQSIEGREVINERTAKYREQFGDKIPRPEWWGGYIIKPRSMEFWQGRPGRLHDRILYSLENSGAWKIERLAP